MYLDIDERQGLISVSLEQARVAEKSGDKEGAKALRENAKRLRFSVVEEEVKKNPQFIHQIAIEAMADPQEGPHQEFTLLLFKYLQENLDLDANP